MESACWGIKFKPIINKVHTDDSKYYLEIVPEVSCLNNFEKIEWKNDKSFYEYIIPMTYKLIVRRRDHKTNADDSIDSLNPMYHSCVDLLHPSATNTILASGDINRIVSDTFIVSKVTANIERCNIIVSKHTEVNTAYNERDNITKSMQTFEKREDFILTKCKIEDTCTATKSTILVEQGRQDTIILADKLANPCLGVTDTVKVLIEKGTDTSQYDFPLVSIGLSDINILDDDLLDDLETIQEILPERSPDEFMQKLSLSPICSVIVNTNCVLVTPPHVNRNDTMISYDNETDRCIMPYKNSSLLEESMYNNITVLRKCLQPISISYGTESFNRITPEIRIEQFMKMIRREILPLKCMLDDIVMKYAALNIKRTDFIRTDVGNKQRRNLKMQFEDKEFEEHSKHVKSNRVVYTIVFDG